MDVSFLMLASSGSIWSVLVRASCQGRFGMSARFIVLACKVSYDPS